MPQRPCSSLADCHLSRLVAGLNSVPRPLVKNLRISERDPALHHKGLPSGNPHLSQGFLIGEATYFIVEEEDFESTLKS